MCRRSTLLLACALSLVVSATDASAARKKRPKKQPAGTPIQSHDVFETEVAVGKKKRMNVSCLGSAAGYTRQSPRGLMFYSYAGAAKREKKPAKKKLYQQIAKNGKKECQAPDFLSLQRYTGRFGEREARRLYDLFAFGATPEEINAAVARGLEGTVQQLLTYVSDPVLDTAVRAELYCDGELPGYHGTTPEDNEQCDPSDINAVYFPGVRYNEYYRTLFGANPFYQKFWLFLHDERMATSSEVLNGCEAHALPTYVDMLRRATLSGDYMQLMREKNSDHLLHLQYLDGARNRGYKPNENYAREFWELGTVGPTNRNNTPVYTDDDIAQAALAFSGWSIESFERDDRWVCLRAYVPDNHAPYAKTIFLGTRYQTTVHNAEDVLRATFNHPRTAEHLAEDLWKEFVNPYPTTGAIQQLAQVIRSNNYNLLPVFRTLMMSRAVYAPRSRKTIIKQPAELLLGFLRTTGIPVHYREIDQFLSRLGQQPLLAPSVFGWNERRYVDEAHVQNWRNVLLSITTRGDSHFTELNYSLHQRFLADLPAQSAARSAIERVSGWLNVDLNERQIQKLDEYMNFNLQRCTSNCNGQPYTLQRSAFDPHPNGNWSTKTRGLLTILAMMPDYIMK